MNTNTNNSGRKISKEKRLEERRKVRSDLGSMRDVMPYPKFEGSDKWRFRWVNNDVKAGVNRVQKLLALGWGVWDQPDKFDVGRALNVTESNTSVGEGVELPVGTTARGEALTAVLMYIDKDIYEADQQLKEEEIQEKEEGIFELQNESGMYGGVRVGRQ